MPLTATLQLPYAILLDIQTKTGYKNHQGVDRLTIDVDHEDTVLRTFILFVQTARAVLKYADTDLYRKARLSIIKLIALRALASNNGVHSNSLSYLEPNKASECDPTFRQIV